MHLPGGLGWLQDEPTGAAWLSELPRTVEHVAELWDLEVGEPFPDSTVGWVAPALREAEPLVVKIQWPHPECEHEAAALATWAGDGAIELLAHDPERHALLLERCTPGTHLARASGAEVRPVLATDRTHLIVEGGHRLAASQTGGLPAPPDLWTEARGVVGIEVVVLDVFSPRWRADLRECRAVR